MNLLCLDTSMEKIAVCIKTDNNEYTYVSAEGSKKHNGILLSEIDNLLKKANLDIADIDVFGVVVGPGSFTGIRVGVATINAFALALNKPIVSVTSLELLFDKNSDALALLDCKHGNFYAATQIGEKVEYMPLTDEEVATYNLKKRYLTEVLPEKLVQCCYQKAINSDYIAQAKPFYLKRSSAERETGILC